MTENSLTDFDLKNRETVYKFLKETEKNADNLNEFTIAVLAQFLLNLRVNICRKSGSRGWIDDSDFIDSQIEELRRCIIDLNNYKERLIKGVTEQ